MYSMKALLLLHEWDCPMPPPKVPELVPETHLKESSQPVGLWSPPQQASWGAARILEAPAALAQRGCSASVHLMFLKDFAHQKKKTTSISGQRRVIWANMIFTPIQRDFHTCELLFSSIGKTQSFCYISNTLLKHCSKCCVFKDTKPRKACKYLWWSSSEYCDLQTWPFSSDAGPPGHSKQVYLPSS